MIRLLAMLAVMASAQVQADGPQRRPGALPCDGVVWLYYGDELIWRKGGGEIEELDGMVKLPEHKGKSGLPLRSLLELRPDVVAIELESCQPRQRRFERADLEAKTGSDLYLVATNYRGFKLRNIAGGQRGRGMKNIGRIVLVPASADTATERSSRSSKEGRPRS